MVIIAQKNKHGVNNKEGMTMKKMITNMKALAALLMVGAAVTSCSSDDSIIGEPDAPQVYTMTVEASKGTNGTRTLALADGGTTLTSTWTAGDKVKVYNSSDTELGELTAQTAGVNTTLSGTLSSLPSNNETLTLKYLSPDYDTQDGTLTGTENSIDKVCDYATATVTATVSGSSVTTTNASFENQQAVVKFTLKNKADNNDLSATELKVTADGNTYTVTPASAASVLYVAVPAISAKQVTLTAKVGSTYYDFGTTSATFENGNFYRITVKMSNGTLSGKFSVSAGKQVYFSKGNLQYTKSPSTWSFMDHQYSTVETNGSVGNNYADKDVVSLFGWGTSNQTIANYGSAYQPWSTIATPEYYGPSGTYNLTGTYANGDWGVNMGSGWRTLTKDEWEYLLQTRGASTVNVTDDARYAMAKVCGVQGMILFPDTYTHPSGVTAPVGINGTDTGGNDNVYDATDWSAMEAAGCVFLPAAGKRLYDSVESVNQYGYYWSSTANDANGAYHVTISSVGVNSMENNSSGRDGGYSVRLVREVE